MGGAASAHRTIRPEWMSIFNAMQFTKGEVNAFHDIFRSVDTDGSGSIDVSELLLFLAIEKSLFAERIFAAFDKDGTGRIDFFEFVVSLWKFCALGRESLSVFAFDLYDTDNDGVLTEMEVKVMFHDLYWYGSDAVEDKASRTMLASLLSVGDSIISVEQFRPFCQQNQVLLMPLLAVQDKLRAAAMGRPFWRAMSERHVLLGQGRKVKLANLMLEPSDRELFYQLLHDQSASGLRHLMRSAIDHVQHRLHLRGQEHAESAAHEDVALQRMFNPVWTKHPLACGSGDSGEYVQSPPSERFRDGYGGAAAGCAHAYGSQRRGSVDTVDTVRGRALSPGFDRVASFSERTVTLD